MVTAQSLIDTADPYSIYPAADHCLFILTARTLQSPHHLVRIHHPTHPYGSAIPLARTDPLSHSPVRVADDDHPAPAGGVLFEHGSHVFEQPLEAVVTRGAGRRRESVTQQVRRHTLVPLQTDGGQIRTPGGGQTLDSYPWRWPEIRFVTLDMARGQIYIPGHSRPSDVYPEGSEKSDLYPGGDSGRPGEAPVSAGTVTPIVISTTEKRTSQETLFLFRPARPFEYFLLGLGAPEPI